jgi:two-component system OmpR family response regulator
MLGQDRRTARKLGASKEEIAEALGVAIDVNAGAALVYSTRTLDAYDTAAEMQLSRGFQSAIAAIESMLMRKVLLIDDDGELAEEIMTGLADFEVAWAPNGADGLEVAHAFKPDVLIIDRRLPGLDGLKVIERLRRDQIHAPVLVLSGLDAVEDRVRGQRAGGDDYLTKPFALIELVARLDALLRRPNDARETILRVGALELDLIERSARRGDRQIELLPREFRLLEYMMRRSDLLLTRAMLLKEVWNYKFVPKTNLVDVHMGHLRHKIDGPDEAPLIHNIRGVGFVLCEATSHTDASPIWTPADCG